MFGFDLPPFDEIRISPDSFDRAFAIDNLRTIAAVPEPASGRCCWLAQA